MNKNLQRICVAVDVDEYEELKKFSKSGLSTGFLIREAIHDLLVKLRKDLFLEYLPFSINQSNLFTIFLQF